MIFDVEFPYKRPYFELLCLPAKIAAETMTRSIDSDLRSSIELDNTIETS